MYPCKKYINAVNEVMTFKSEYATSIRRGYKETSLDGNTEITMMFRRLGNKRFEVTETREMKCSLLGHRVSESTMIREWDDYFTDHLEDTVKRKQSVDGMRVFILGGDGDISESEYLEFLKARDEAFVPKFKQMCFDQMEFICESFQKERQNNSGV